MRKGREKRDESGTRRNGNRKYKKRNWWQQLMEREGFLKDIEEAKKREIETDR